MESILNDAYVIGTHFRKLPLALFFNSRSRHTYTPTLSRIYSSWLALNPLVSSDDVTVFVRLKRLDDWE